MTVIVNGPEGACPKPVREALNRVYTRAGDHWEALVEASPRRGGCKLTLRGPQGHWRMYRIPPERCQSHAYMTALLRAETMAFPSLPARGTVHAIGELEHLGMICELGRLFSGYVTVEGQSVSAGELAELYRSGRLGRWASRLKGADRLDVSAEPEKMIMNIAEFLEVLAGVRANFDWTLTEDSGYPDDRRGTPRRHIRGRPSRRPASSVTLDPLRAVCYVETGEMYGPDAWAEAGSALGLNVADARDIADAANDQTWSGVDGERFPDRELGALRLRLLETVGLR